MENKIDDKMIEEMLNDEEFMKLVEEKVKSEEISLDGMENVTGGMSREQVREMMKNDYDKYQWYCEFRGGSRNWYNW